MERAGGPGAARRLCLVTLPLSTGNGVSDPSCDDFYLFGVRGLTREETLAVPSAMKSRAGDGHNLGGRTLVYHRFACLPVTKTISTNSETGLLPESQPFLFEAVNPQPAFKTGINIHNLVTRKMPLS